MMGRELQLLLKPAILNASSYHVPESTGFIKLDAMENPYPWPEELRQPWRACLQQANVNRYPDANAREMRTLLHDLLEVPDAATMLFGNGSDELIQIILMALAPTSSNTVLAPEPTFVMYRHISEMLNLNFIGVPLTSDFSLDMPTMLKCVEERQPAVIFLAWPNNPTGNAFASEGIRAIIEASHGLVVIDEAYHAFTGQTLLAWVKRYPNLMVMRTLSKLGLAGLRLGILIGSPVLLNELEKIRLPYNIGALNQLGVNFACHHIDILYQQVGQIKRECSNMYQALSAMQQLETWPSITNFILFRSHGITADDIYTALLKRKILIKNLSAAHPLLDNCLRVTIGTSEENQIFLHTLRKILKAA